jgi:hypothetical protein
MRSYTYIGELAVLEDEKVVFSAQFFKALDNGTIKILKDVDMGLERVS